ncbi:MAG: hypothetical protein WBV79_06835, partial [Rhodomicrobium sp.]
LNWECPAMGCLCMFGLGDLDDFIAVIECLYEVLHHAFELGKQRPTAEIAYSHENDGAEI